MSGNMLNGRGEFVWPNGDKFIGDYVEGKRNGPGEMIFQNGNSYKGTWKAGLYHGEGTFR